MQRNLSQKPVVSVTRFKDLADQIGAGDPDTKLLLPSVGPVKTNLCEWFENKYTLYFWFSMGNPDFSGGFSKFDLPKNVVRWITIGIPLVNATK